MILQELNKDGRMSVTDLAKLVGSSRPTITNRLARLREEGILKIPAGMDLTTLGLKMATIGLEVRGDENKTNLLELLKKCPRVQTIYRRPFIANIQVGIWGEDESTINCCIDSFRNLPGVQIIETNYLGTPIHGNIILQVKMGKDEVTKCQKTCSSCNQYMNDWCPGCPGTISYKNPLIVSS
jgi:DNA-binding Lrp family transcriptional regulator